MATIHPGRYTAEIEGDFVVFLIGMRLNRPWKLHRWPVLCGRSAVTPQYFLSIGSYRVMVTGL